MICAIVAMSQNRIIGRDGGLPWYLPEDLKRVSTLTTGHVVLMGRSTFFSLPKKFRPLPHRISIVVSSGLEKAAMPDPREDDLATECHLVRGVEEGIQWYETHKKAGQILWIFGGASIYQQTQDLWDQVYLTLIESKIEGDRKFPEFESAFEEVQREQMNSAQVGDYSFIRYNRRKCYSDKH